MQAIQNLKQHELIKLANENITANNLKVGTQIELYTLGELHENKLDDIYPYIINNMENYFGMIGTITYINKVQGLVNINMVRGYSISPFWIKNIIQLELE